MSSNGGLGIPQPNLMPALQSQAKRTPSHQWYLSRLIHAATLAVTLVVWFWLIFTFPDLWSNPSTRFSTVCNGATVYGLLVTIVELLRTQSAAALAAESAEGATVAVNNLNAVKEISECQMLIDVALTGIERDGAVNPSHLVKITRIYGAEFQNELADDGSVHRKNIAYLESYSSASAKVRASGATQLNGRLISMSEHLAASASNKTTGIR